MWECLHLVVQQQQQIPYQTAATLKFSTFCAVHFDDKIKFNLLKLEIICVDFNETWLLILSFVVLLISPKNNIISIPFWIIVEQCNSFYQTRFQELLEGDEKQMAANLWIRQKVCDWRVRVCINRMAVLSLAIDDWLSQNKNTESKSKKDTHTLNGTTPFSWVFRLFGRKMHWPKCCAMCVFVVVVTERLTKSVLDVHNSCFFMHTHSLTFRVTIYMSLFFQASLIIIGYNKQPLLFALEMLSRTDAFCFCFGFRVLCFGRAKCPFFFLVSIRFVLSLFIHIGIKVTVISYFITVGVEQRKGNHFNTKLYKISDFSVSFCINANVVELWNCVFFSSSFLLVVSFVGRRSI